MSAELNRPAPHKSLTIWPPDDREFRVREGEAIANFKLWISIPALFLAFVVFHLSFVALTCWSHARRYAEFPL